MAAAGSHLVSFFTSSLVIEIATRPPLTLSLSAGTTYSLEKKPKNPDERILGLLHVAVGQYVHLDDLSDLLTDPSRTRRDLPGPSP